MKKLFRNILAVVTVIISMLLLNVNVYAASVTLTGPTTVRAGDTITISIKIAEAGRNAIEGTLSYDSNQVTLSGIAAARTGWKAENNGNTMMAYDDNMTNATTANAVVATVTFKVKSTVQPGTTLKISLTNTSVSASGGASYDIGTVTYSVTIAQPLSSVNTLSSLVVTGQTLSPAFSSNTTTYNLGEVDYSVSKLNITATPTDSKAKVTISGNNLAVGKNTVTITVKAENGSTKNYQITVTRKQDPNYKASSNANISQITISQGQLSPSFSADITDYVVYVPYEMVGKSVDLSGKAQDAKAVGVKSAKLESLVEGANVATLICTAEDGSTKEYKITVYVMPKYEGELPEIGEDVETPTEEPTKEEVPTTQAPTEEPTTQAPTEEDTTAVQVTENGSDDTWKIVVFTIVGVAVGFGICLIVFMAKKKNEE